MHRRRLLKTLSGVGVVGVAGCTGDEDNDSNPNNDGGASSGDGTDGENDSDANNGDETEEGSSPDFPSQDIELIIPFSPGGGYDYYGRSTGEYMSQYLPTDVDVVFQNVEGAAGQIGITELYNSEPNGHTIGVINSEYFTKMQITEDFDFDIRNISFFAQVMSAIRCITLGKNVGIGSWDEYISAVQNEDIMFGTADPVSLKL